MAFFLPYFMYSVQCLRVIGLQSRVVSVKQSHDSLYKIEEWNIPERNKVYILNEFHDSIVSLDLSIVSNVHHKIFNYRNWIFYYIFFGPRNKQINLNLKENNYLLS